MRSYHSVEYWRANFNYRALILISPGGSSFLLLPNQSAKGRFALLGVIE